MVPSLVATATVCRWKTPERTAGIPLRKVEAEHLAIGDIPKLHLAWLTGCPKQNTVGRDGKAAQGGLVGSQFSQRLALPGPQAGQSISPARYQDRMMGVQQQAMHPASMGSKFQHFFGAKRLGRASLESSERRWIDPSDQSAARKSSIDWGRRLRIGLKGLFDGDRKWGCDGGIDIAQQSNSHSLFAQGRLGENGQAEQSVEGGG